jgi:hypothetical protein
VIRLVQRILCYCVGVHSVIFKLHSSVHATRLPNAILSIVLKYIMPPNDTDMQIYGRTRAEGVFLSEAGEQDAP